MQIVLLGYGPWPLEPGAVVIAPSGRLRQFKEALTAAKHDVTIIMLENSPRKAPRIDKTVAVHVVTPEEILDPEVLARLLPPGEVDVVAGVGSLMPVAAAVRLATRLDRPCWADLFGDPLAELHALQLRQPGSIDGVLRDHIWKLMREALLGADAFSTLSSPQRYALLGQLGLLGRYGQDWDVSGRIHEIVIGVPDSSVEKKPWPDFPEAYSNAGLDDKHRIILFTGSWNVWLDEVTMGQAIAQTLKENKSFRFVMSGIPTGPAGETVRNNLLNILSDAAVMDQVCELAPTDLDQESALLAHANSCIILDRLIPESELGARNRLISMVRWGVKPVVSLNAETEALLAAEGLAIGVAQNDWQKAARELAISASRSQEERMEDRDRGLEFLSTISYRRTVEPMIRWLAAGAPRWPKPEVDGMLDRWAAFPADPEKLFGAPQKQKKGWFFS